MSIPTQNARGTLYIIILGTIPIYNIILIKRLHDINDI